MRQYAIDIPYRDNDGVLAVLGNDGLPFKVARIFWMTGVPIGATRGDHAHIKTKQIACALAGEWEVYIEQDRVHGAQVRLRPEHTALYIPPLHWVRMTARTADGILLILADRPYLESDYIRNRSKWEAAL